MYVYRYIIHGMYVVYVYIQTLLISGDSRRTVETDGEQRILVRLTEAVCGYLHIYSIICCITNHIARRNT